MYELTTAGYPDSQSGGVSCTMKFEALNGLKPAIEFIDWEPANCRTDRFHIIDRKDGFKKNFKKLKTKFKKKIKKKI